MFRRANCINSISINSINSITSREHGSRLNGGASPAPSASFQGGASRPAPPGAPPAFNHPPFSIRPWAGPARGRPRSVEERRRSCSVWCWPTAKFIHWKPRRRLASHTLYSNSRRTDAGPQSFGSPTGLELPSANGSTARVKGESSAKSAARVRAAVHALGSGAGRRERHNTASGVSGRGIGGGEHAP